MISSGSLFPGDPKKVPSRFRIKRRVLPLLAGIVPRGPMVAELACTLEMSASLKSDASSKLNGVTDFFRRIPQNSDNLIRLGTIQYYF